MSQGNNPESYFVFVDGSCIIEIEINAGSMEENRVVEEMSIRFAVTNPIDTFQKAKSKWIPISLVVGSASVAFVVDAGRQNDKLPGNTV
jgi:hypothetical protein